MASRYWVGGAGTWNTSATTHWAATSGGAAGASVPTSADDVIFDANSGTGSIVWTGAIACNNFTASTSTALSLSTGSSYTLSISGSYTGGSSFTMASTYSTAVPEIIFTATSTGQTITTAGKIMPNLTFNGAGGGWTFQDNFAGPSSGTLISTIILITGSLNLNGKTFTQTAFDLSGSLTRSLTCGAASITFTSRAASAILWDASGSNFTFSCDTSTINGATPPASGNYQFNGGGKTYYNLTFTCSTSVSYWSTNNIVSCNNLTVTNTAAATYNRFYINDDITISGAFTVTGNTEYVPITVIGDTTLNTTVTANGTLALSKCGFIQMTGAGSASWSLGSATAFGDCGWNSGITFTTAITIYYYRGTGNLTTTGVWMTGTNGTGATRRPLPQDTLIFNANSFNAASQVFTISGAIYMPKMDFTGGVLNSPTISMTAAGITSTFHGDLLFPSSGLTLTGSTSSVTFNGSSATVTSAGRQFPGNIIVSTPGTVTFSDALSVVGKITCSKGTATFNSAGVTASGFSSSSSNVRTVNMGGGTWNITLATVGIGWTTSNTTNLTFNKSTSNINFTNTTTNQVDMFGGGLTFNEVSFVGASGINSTGTTFGKLNITTGSATKPVVFAAGQTFNVANVNFSGVGLLSFGTGTTLNLTGTITAMAGTAGNLLQMWSATSGNAWYITQSGGRAVGDYLNLRDSNASGASFYAGANSTNTSGNTGWLFTAAPNGSIASAAGTSTISGVGKSKKRAAAITTGTSTATATGKANARAPGTSAGVGAAAAVGKGAKKAVAASAGVGVASAIGKNVKKAVAASSGTSTVSAAGKGGYKGVGSTAGTSTVSAGGRAGRKGVGSAAGVATTNFVGLLSGHSVGDADGTSTASAVGRSKFKAVGAAAGTSSTSVTGYGRISIRSVGAASGSSATSVVGKTTKRFVGAASGSSVVTGHIYGKGKGVAASTGVSSTSFIGKNVKKGVAASVGASTVQATSKAVKRSVGTTTGTGTGHAVAKFKKTINVPLTNFTLRSGASKFTYSIIKFTGEPVPIEHMEDAQLLEADAYVELFQIILSDKQTKLYLKLNHDDDWGGNTYEGTGIKLDGVGKYADDQVARPKLTLFNPEGVYSYLVDQGLLDGATIVRYRVLKDDVTNDRPIYRRQQWKVSRIASVKTGYIGLELRDMMDGQIFTTPARMFIPPDFPTVSLS